MDVRTFFNYTTALRRRILEALQHVPAEVLERDLGTNHHSILRTLLHTMAVQESWLNEDILGHSSQTWDAFRQRYLPGGESLQALQAGWEDITEQILAYLASDPDLQRVIPLPPPRDAITVEQIFYHIATEEMIHFGEILAMTRQLGIDLPGYFLLDVMSLPASGDGATGSGPPPP